MLFISATPLHQQSGSRTILKKDLKMDLKVLAVGGSLRTTLEHRRRKNRCGATIYNAPWISLEVLRMMQWSG
ncbi:hypothetical protein ACIPRI_04855 [Variovorax sp. LARHSF232]